jgi:hypothetical protein
MFERFTDEAREVVVEATREARALDHRHVGTEHLLLGLLHDRSGVGGRAFASLGVSRDDARARVMAVVRSDTVPPSDPVSLTARAKELLALSVREARKHSHSHAGTGDLALALLRVRDGTALRVLSDLGVARDVAHTRVLEIIAETDESRSRPLPNIVLSRQLPPHAQELLRKALRAGSLYMARRYMPPRLLRSASTTARFVRTLGTQPEPPPTEQSRLGSGSAPRGPSTGHKPYSRLPSTTHLVPAACLVCGHRPPDCGTLYAGAHGALICEHCIRDATTGTQPGEPPARH